MPVIDFHNHYYPPKYLEALRSGGTSVKVTVDRVETGRHSTAYRRTSRMQS